MTYKLPPKLKSYIRSELYKYPLIETYINARKTYLQTKPKELDENQGGGRSSFISNPTESLALEYSEDSVLTSLESLRAIVLNLLGNSSSTTQSFVESVYFNDRTSSRNIRYAIPIASASLGLTDRQGYRIDKDFVNRFAVEGGYVDSRGNVLDLGRDVMGGERND